MEIALRKRDFDAGSEKLIMNFGINSMGHFQAHLRAREVTAKAEVQAAIPKKLKDGDGFRVLQDFGLLPRDVEEDLLHFSDV